MSPSAKQLARLLELRDELQNHQSVTAVPGTPHYDRLAEVLAKLELSIEYETAKLEQPEWP